VCPTTDVRLLPAGNGQEAACVLVGRRSTPA
jgi:hypothetical protein